MLIDETVQDISQIKGFAKAVTIQTDKIYIEIQDGINGVSLVEKEMEKMGFSFRFSSPLSPTDLIPLSLRIASLLAIKNVFHLDDNQIKEIGRLATKSSFFTKLTLRYLVSLKKMAREIPRHWQRHYTVGTMDPGELHEDEHFFIVRLKNFMTHPLYCTYLSGYIIGVVELIGTFPNLTIQETKCQYHGEEYHEFRVSWE